MLIASFAVDLCFEGDLFQLIIEAVEVSRWGLNSKE
jgi:hypothetical protein